MTVRITLKQQKFIDEFILSGNAKDAAIKAGYKPKYAKQMGAENLSKPYLHEILEKRQQELSDAKKAGQDETLEFLTSVLRGEVTETVVTVKGVFEVPVSARERIRAAELLGKRFGMWKSTIDLTTTDIHLTIGGDDDWAQINYDENKRREQTTGYLAVN